VKPFALKLPNELDALFAALAAQHPDALQLIADSGLLDLSDRIAALAIAHRIPSFCSVAPFVVLGGLLSIWSDGTRPVRSGGSLRETDSGWRFAGRASSAATHKGPAGHQPKDGQGPRPQHPTYANFPCRSGYRITPAQCSTASRFHSSQQLVRSSRRCKPAGTAARRKEPADGLKN